MDDGFAVGPSEGDAVGCFVGPNVGASVGDSVGFEVVSIAAAVGSIVRFCVFLDSQKSLQHGTFEHRYSTRTKQCVSHPRRDALIIIIHTSKSIYHVIYNDTWHTISFRR